VLLHGAGLLILATSGQSIRAYDTNKDLKLVIETTTRREPWSIAEVEGSLILVGTNEGYLQLFEAFP